MIQRELQFEPARKLSRQCGLVLARLREGPATNVDLNAICFRYGARIYDLVHQHGFTITSKKIKGSLWEFRLI